MPRSTVSLVSFVLNLILGMLVLMLSLRVRLQSDADVRYVCRPGDCAKLSGVFSSSHGRSCVPDYLKGQGMLAAAKRIPTPSDKMSYPWGIHSYEAMYEKYLGMFKYTCGLEGPVKVFEIGLGPGGNAMSMSLYQQFMPDRVVYHALEYEDQREKIQASKFLTDAQKAHLLSHLVIGDQAKAAALEQALQWAPFDVIVDDGGHTSDQQRTSFQYLFTRALKPGGVYIIEDLQTSFHPHWGGGEKPQKDMKTAVAMLSNMMTAMHFHWWDSPNYNDSLSTNEYGQEMHMPGFEIDEGIMKWVASIECQRELCAIRKRFEELPMKPHKKM
jgi:hypothetical protein